ncbi:lipoate--protein ligase [Massilibacterium senegalense]|uniref:lipoate--protein ligase n=1 Tax=Massilibacterium senegalense TaxID=1632858 RepID=UPI0007860B06|nr:lipoate--protein ligase [Massilibacterium senegalense]
MKFINNQNITDPTINLAIEEYAVSELDPNETYLLFYVNEPSIIIGKNQNTIEEINDTYVKENGIHVVRRLSGGGAVYHDFGNLNFSFITTDDGDSFHNFKKFTDPVVTALQRLGIDAKLSGRNDIQVGERKISGNAQFKTKGRMFSHGTLLLDSHLDDVVKALHVKTDKIASKGIKSIRSRVANINEFLQEPLTMETFKKQLLVSIFQGEENISFYEWTEQDWERVHEISEQRYRNWDWNYGKSPKFNVQHAKRFPIGQIEVRLFVEKGYIEEAKIFGDFFGVKNVQDIEKALIKKRYVREEIQSTLETFSLPEYFGNVTLDDILDMLC